ncbi:MAG: DUF1269 domain-containing protein [Deltaproteobacteria bacterium]|nr:DUF1269 domain-containing protein [Deltaproteobacteria bacterium]
MFASEDAAVDAAKALKSWDKANEDVKLGAIGVLQMTEKGKLKVKKMGPRSTGKGALIGAVAGGLVAVFAPATLIGGALAGAATGGVIGAFTKKGLGLSDEQKDKIKANLDAGKGLLIVLVDDFEVAPTKDELTRLGGETDSAKADADAIDDTDKAMAKAGVQAEIETETA